MQAYINAGSAVQWMPLSTHHHRPQALPHQQNPCTTGSETAHAARHTPSATQRPHNVQITRRRVLGVSPLPLLFLPNLAEALKSELSLWGQEAGYLTRRAKEAVNIPPDPPTSQQALPTIPLDEGLARSLLDIPVLAARAVADDAFPGPVNYDAKFARLKAQELPFFEEYGACGSCGKQGLKDPAWFNFLSYIQYKTLQDELQPKEVPRVVANGFEYLHRNSVPMMLDPESCEDREQQASTSTDSVDDSYSFFTNKDGRAVSRWPGLDRSNSSSNIITDPASKRVAAFRAVVGRMLLDRLESAEGPLTGTERELLGLKTGQLDVIRQGVRVLLGALQRLGFLAGSYVTAFGISDDEFENHMVWALGEPAFVKVWQSFPATERSETALQAEQGWSQDFVYLLLAAYLGRNGVSARNLKRFPYVTKQGLIAEQFTIRQVAPVPDEVNEAEAAVLGNFPRFSLDKCPGAYSPDGDEEVELEEAVGC